MAVIPMCDAKKDISANQMKRTWAWGHKTAWYLCHGIQEANDRIESEAAY